MQRLRFTTIEDVRNVLAMYNIDTAKWGQGNAKSIESLLKELTSEECFLYLEDDKLVRVVNALFIHIEKGMLVLTEIQQTFHDTSDRPAYTRKRSCVLAEKLLDGEDIKAAIVRALNEELGIKRDEVVFKLKEETERKFSQSYPELQCLFYKKNVYINIQDLDVNIPDGFEFTEYFEDGTPRVTSTWGWR
jgi:hypothetical protein